jgi:hypothetical protein
MWGNGEKERKKTCVDTIAKASITGLRKTIISLVTREFGLESEWTGDDGGRRGA